ncbi:MAG: NUDIX hydrolase [Pseudomonadaceae bacterium]|nr:NUDIX hydrolase [Pseudomonadaceae bacterium]
MKFCSNCGATLTFTIPPGDNRERHVCNDCDTIHYVNPRIITGCLPIWDDRVLLCLRAINPRKGYWTLPAGFLENGETIAAGAARETEEEANARVSDLELYTVFSLPHISQAYMFYRAQLRDLDFSSGEESLDVRLFKEDEIPWDNLAFPVINKSLQYYFDDRKSGQFQFRSEAIEFKRR